MLIENIIKKLKKKLALKGFHYSIVSPQVKRATSGVTVS
jgi:outer membrane protein assembly factor BamA